MLPFSLFHVLWLEPVVLNFEGFTYEGRPVEWALPHNLPKSWTQEQRNEFEDAYGAALDIHLEDVIDYDADMRLEELEHFHPQWTMAKTQSTIDDSFNAIDLAFNIASEIGGGFDGIVAEDVVIDMEAVLDPTTAYVAFSPKQVKKVGAKEYDPDSPDLWKQRKIDRKTVPAGVTLPKGMVDEKGEVPLIVAAVR